MCHTILIIASDSFIRGFLCHRFRIGHNKRMSRVPEHGNIVFRVAKSRNLFRPDSPPGCQYTNGIGFADTGFMYINENPFRINYGNPILESIFQEFSYFIPLL